MGRLEKVTLTLSINLIMQITKRLLIFLPLFISVLCYAQVKPKVVPVKVQPQKGRFVKDLSNNNWKLILDEKAEWINDSLYLSPVNIAGLPVNEPTGGWR